MSNEAPQWLDEFEQQLGQLCNSENSSHLKDKLLILSTRTRVTLRAILMEKDDGGNRPSLSYEVIALVNELAQIDLFNDKLRRPINDILLSSESHMDANIRISELLKALIKEEGEGGDKKKKKILTFIGTQLELILPCPEAIFDNYGSRNFLQRIKLFCKYYDVPYDFILSIEAIIHQIVETNHNTDPNSFPKPVDYSAVLSDAFLLKDIASSKKRAPLHSTKLPEKIGINELLPPLPKEPLDIDADNTPHQISGELTIGDVPEDELEELEEYTGDEEPLPPAFNMVDPSPPDNLDSIDGDDGSIQNVDTTSDTQNVNVTAPPDAVIHEDALLSMPKQPAVIQRTKVIIPKTSVRRNNSLLVNKLLVRYPFMGLLLLLTILYPNNDSPLVGTDSSSECTQEGGCFDKDRMELKIGKLDNLTKPNIQELSHDDAVKIMSSYLENLPRFVNSPEKIQPFVHDLVEAIELSGNVPLTEKNILYFITIARRESNFISNPIKQKGDVMLSNALNILLAKWPVGKKLLSKISDFSFDINKKNLTRKELDELLDKLIALFDNDEGVIKKTVEKYLSELRSKETELDIYKWAQKVASEIDKGEVGRLLNENTLINTVQSAAGFLAIVINADETTDPMQELIKYLQTQPNSFGIFQINVDRVIPSIEKDIPILKKHPNWKHWKKAFNKSETKVNRDILSRALMDDDDAAICPQYVAESLLIRYYMASSIFANDIIQNGEVDDEELIFAANDHHLGAYSAQNGALQKALNKYIRGEITLDGDLAIRLPIGECHSGETARALMMALGKLQNENNAAFIKLIRQSFILDINFDELPAWMTDNNMENLKQTLVDRFVCMDDRSLEQTAIWKWLVVHQGCESRIVPDWAVSSSSNMTIAKTQSKPSTIYAEKAYKTYGQIKNMRKTPRRDQKKGRR